MSKRQFPLLPAYLPGREALRAIIKHDAPGAVIETAHGYSVITWQDVAEAAAPDSDPPLERMKSHKIVADVEIVDGIATVDWRRFPRHVEAMMALAPKYVCPNGDDISETSGFCRYDGLPLVRK